MSPTNVTELIVSVSYIKRGGLISIPCGDIYTRIWDIARFTKKPTSPVSTDIKSTSSY